jgi:uncharacterized membrane protein
MAQHTDPNEMLIVSYPDVNRAEQVLKSVQQLDHEHVVHLKNSAIITRDSGGKITVREARDIDPKQGAIVGALAGGLLSRLTGGSLLGEAALGAAGGYIAGRVIDLGINDDYLREIAGYLQPGSSAIVAIVHFDHADQATQTLQQFAGGRVLRQTLPPDIAQQLANVVQG